eukprot:6290353-Prymnesium_polylepis.1
MACVPKGCAYFTELAARRRAEQAAMLKLRLALRLARSEHDTFLVHACCMMPGSFRAFRAPVCPFCIEVVTHALVGDPSHLM